MTIPYMYSVPVLRTSLKPLTWCIFLLFCVLKYLKGTKQQQQKKSIHFMCIPVKNVGTG